MFQIYMFFQQLENHRISQKFLSNKDTVITHPQEGDDVVIFNWGQYIKRTAKLVNQKWKFNNSDFKVKNLWHN